MAENIGNTPTNQAGQYGNVGTGYRCLVCLDNPSSSNGLIISASAWFSTAPVVSFKGYILTLAHEGGGVFSARDYEEVDFPITTGLKEWTGLSLAYQAGDYIGVALPIGVSNYGIDVVTTGGDGVYRNFVASAMPIESETFSNLDNTSQLQLGAVLNTIPDTPTNTSPTDGLAGQSVVPTLESSAYSGDGTHTASQWQITTTSGSYTNPIYDSGEDTTNLVSITISSGYLYPGTMYYWHVRHKNAVGWSSYSTETDFTTGGLKAMSTGLKARLQTITDINHVFSSVELPNAVNEFPCALILPGETIYDRSFSNKIDTIFRVLILMSKQDNPSAFSRLLDYMEPTGVESVYAAIDADTTLGGTADDCMVIKCSGAGAVSWGGHVYLGTEFEVVVFG